MTDPICLPMQVGKVAGPSGPVHAGPCTMVILGAAGDLTRRKLLPSLFHLESDGALHEEFAVLGVGREPLSDETFRAQVCTALGASGALWERFAPRLFYAAGNFAEAGTFDDLAKRLRLLESTGGEERGRLFYLAVPPSVYPIAIEGLSRSGAMPRRPDPADPRWVRTVIEKPFGTSLVTAQALNRVVRAALAEHQVYRIDHYLGKETVQNLLVFRFANSIFEPVWNRHHVHHVQITAAETLGVEHRAGYYEEAGVVRDMFQNHLLSLLSLTAMEPPATFNADSVRDEKAKVLNAIRPVPAADLAAWAVRGQYGPGAAGARVPGYRKEEGIRADSPTPTYAALRLMIDNWRWEGVPFFLRSGKRLANRVTEIAIEFRKPPHVMFPLGRGETIAPNVLVVRVQPEEGLSISFEIKVPGIGVRITSARMEFGYAEAFGGQEHDAYETLLLDCMAGDPTLFTRSDATEAAWRVVDPVIQGWEREPPADFPNYPAGSWGPEAAERLIGCAGAAWRRP